MENKTQSSNYEHKLDEMSQKLSLTKEAVKKLAIFEYYNKHFLEEDR